MKLSASLADFLNTAIEQSGRAVVFVPAGRVAGGAPPAVLVAVVGADSEAFKAYVMEFFARDGAAAHEGSRLIVTPN